MDPHLHSLGSCRLKSCKKSLQMFVLGMWGVAWVAMICQPALHSVAEGASFALGARHESACILEDIWIIRELIAVPVQIAQKFIVVVAMRDAQHVGIVGAELHMSAQHFWVFELHGHRQCVLKCASADSDVMSC